MKNRDAYIVYLSLSLPSSFHSACRMWRGRGNLTHAHATFYNFEPPRAEKSKGEQYQINMSHFET
jgi:hypothetical protein